MESLKSKRPETTRLILADVHPLNPFNVPGYQFACRAVSFSRSWPGAVELWVPGPALDQSALSARTFMEPADSFRCRFGPLPVIRILGLKLKSKALLRAWLRKQVKRLAAAGENCLFYFRTIRLAHTLGPLLERCGYRYVFEPHEVFYENAKDPDQFKQLEQTVYQQAAHLFPISRTLGQHLARKFAVKTPIVAGPLGHSGRNFALPDYDPAAPPRFLYTGSLHRWKGLELAVAATSEFKLPFDIVGDAGGLERCWDFCQANHYSHVIFHGQIPPEQLSGKYTTGSICLLPLSNEEIARSYTSPLKLFDYLAAGRPVVAGDLPTVREVVEDGVQARLLPVDDPGAWKTALGDLLCDRAQAARLARQGRELAQRCTWSERAKALVPVLESLT